MQPQNQNLVLVFLFVLFVLFVLVVNVLRLLRRLQRGFHQRVAVHQRRLMCSFLFVFLLWYFLMTPDMLVHRYLFPMLHDPFFVLQQNRSHC
jgi:hypothetical protein